MTPAFVALLGAVGVAAGAAIGVTGVGGVAVVPLLVGLAGLDSVAAIAIAEFGYVVTGLIGLYVHIRQGTMRGRSALPLLIAAAPAAAAGAVVAPRLPASALGVGLAGLMIAGGLFGVRRPRSQAAGASPGTATLVGCGLVAGAASALTGTGGPAVLLPMLTLLRIPAGPALALAQIVQVPIAGAATVANVAQGTLVWGSALVLALALAFGALVGTWLAAGLDANRLRFWISAALLVAGMVVALEQVLAIATGGVEPGRSRNRL